MGLGLSTAWNAFRYTDGKKMLFEIKDLGFDEVELSFNLTAAMVEDIEGLVRQGQIQVLSLHNYCPIPETFPRKDALPDCYSMSSADEEERQMALKFTQRSIDTAARVGAKAVVLHTGRVQMPDHTRALIDLYLRGRKEFPEFIGLRDDFIREREKLRQPFFENTLRSLEALSRFAQDRNISLGIENRFYYREIPTLEEVGIILDTLKGANLFYWHDTGHAEIMENLGIWRHRAFLDAYGHKMLGVHLHNVIETRDHGAPICGEIDFNELAPYLGRGTIKIIEAHYPASAQQLKESKIFLETVFDGRI